MTSSWARLSSTLLPQPARRPRRDAGDGCWPRRSRSRSGWRKDSPSWRSASCSHRRGVDAAASHAEPASPSNAVGRGSARKTVRVDDPAPGIELQVDFGRMGLVPDGEKQRVCHGLDLHGRLQPAHVRVADLQPEDGRDHRRLRSGLARSTAVFSRWSSPTTMSTIVTKADNIAPRLNDVFLEYAQSRGFLVDAARVATPTDKPRVERVVPYARSLTSSPRRTSSISADARRRAPAVVRRDRRHACPRHDSVPPGRDVPGRGAAPAAPACRPRRSTSLMERAQGAQGLPRPGRQGPRPDNPHWLAVHPVAVQPTVAV